MAASVRYDAAVIGTGPAGLQAALNLTLRGKHFVLFGPQELSRKITAAHRVDNYLGLPGVTGPELQGHLLSHLAAMDISIDAQRVQMIYPMGEYFSLACSQTIYEATTVILAPGTFSGKFLPGEQALLGKGVSYCATCDAALYRNKTVVVLLYTDHAVEEAEFLADIAQRVYAIPMKQNLRVPVAPVQLVQGSVSEILGEDLVRGVLLDGQPLLADGVFILRETVAHASLIPGIELDDGFIRVDAAMATNLPGCFAAGDCTGYPHQYMRAAGQGATAALSAVSYLHKIAQKSASNKGKE